MRAVIQRVVRAAVSVDAQTVSQIQRGLMVLVGITADDTADDIEYIANKILMIKLFEDENSKMWSKSVVERNFEVLSVSQFTLYASLKKNKPDYRLAMSTDRAREFYHAFLDRLRTSYRADRIQGLTRASRS
eukprot:m.715863 g.715863  ORF g.715863 m.715863 type:complete len:132 (+) comp58791_c0_seq1:35-430(+)